LLKYKKGDLKLKVVVLHHKKMLLALLLLLGYLLPFSAQAATPLDEIQQWSIITASGPIAPGSKWKVYAEVQPRLGRLNDLTEINRLLVRPAIGYQITPHVSVWQGYAWTPSWNERTNQFRNENRLFQQVLVENKWKQLDWKSRTRLEERFIEDTSGTTAVRFRQMVRGQIPISKDKKWSAVAYDELFIDLNKVPNNNKAGYDQNRVFVGINRKFNQHINAEAGYMLNTVNRLNKADQFNHIIMVQLNYKW
jgi:Protein of unknown function (DUF2490)